jgi:hypothetical protein
MLHITVFGNVTTCNLLDIYKGFGETLSFHYQVRTLNMDGADCSQMLRGYNQAILFLGYIEKGTWPSRLGETRI